jgi:hypothetical protein
MNVHSQSAAPVMTMNGMMETSLALSARPDTNVTKVGFEFLFFCGFLFFFCFFFCYSCFLFYDVRDGGDIYYCMMDDEDDDRFFCWQIIAGSPRVAGDEEEEGVDDLENEFNLADANKQEEQHELHGHMSYSDTYDRDLPEHMVHAPTQPQYPLLTNGQVVPDSEDDEQVIVGPPGLGNGGKRVHPLPYLDSSIPGTLPQTANFRSLVGP